MNWYDVRRPEAVSSRTPATTPASGDERDDAPRAGARAAAERSRATARERPSRLRGLREGWAWAPRRWTQVTADTGIGNPSQVDRRRKAQRLCERGGRAHRRQFLVELAKADLAKLYE